MQPVSCRDGLSDGLQCCLKLVLTRSPDVIIRSIYAIASERPSIYSVPIKVLKNAVAAAKPFQREKIGMVLSLQPQNVKNQFDDTPKATVQVR
jgi:hypothetical protein